MLTKSKEKPLLFLLIFINIFMQLGSAALLKIASTTYAHNILFLLFLFGAVLALNFGRFLAWGKLHKHFPLSITYPVSAAFFPCLLVLSYFLGEPVGIQQIAGAILVTMGIIMVVRSYDSSPEPLKNKMK